MKKSDKALRDKIDLEVISRLTAGMTELEAVEAACKFFGYELSVEDLFYDCDNNPNIAIIFLLLFRNYTEERGGTTIDQRAAMIDLAHQRYTREHAPCMLSTIKRVVGDAVATGPRITVTYRINKNSFDDIDALADRLYEKCTNKPEQWVVWMNAIASNPDNMLQIWNQLARLDYIGDCTYEEFREPFEDVIYINGPRAAADLKSYVFKCNNCGDEHIHILTEPPKRYEIIKAECDNKGYTTKQKYIRPVVGPERR